MAIDLTKVPLLSHVQYLYGDIRDRIKEKYSKPEEGIPASDLAPGVIPDIGLIENGKAPIIMETASGNPIVFHDGAAGLPLSECELTLLPKQDLHGQTAPYPPGGGKNLLNVTASTTTVNGVTYTIESDGTVRLSGTASARSVFKIAENFSLKAGTYKLNGSPQTIPVSCYLNFNGGGVSASETMNALDVSFTLAEDVTTDYLRFDIASGTVTDGLIFKPMIRLSSVSDSTFAPYSNICPIEPWGEVGTWTGGKNLFDEANAVGYERYISYISLTGSTWRTSGDSKSYTIKVKANTKYTVKANNSNITIFRIGILHDDPAYAETNTNLDYAYDTNANKTFTITTPNYDCWLVIQYNKAIADERNGQIQIEVGEQATFYETATIIPRPIDLTGITPPVYGCEINPITGEVWGTWASFSAKWKDGVSTGTLGGTIERKSFSMPVTFVNATGPVTAYCNVAKWKWNFEEASNHFYSHASTSYVFLPDDTDGETDIHIVGKLAAPVLLATLTPQEIETLLGTNTIWSDANGINLEYRADTELFVNQNSVKDVRVNGTSVTTDGVANIPQASINDYGAVKVNSGYGIDIGTTIQHVGYIRIYPASVSDIKAGASYYAPITVRQQHNSTFYGLATAAGDTTQSQSSNAVGTYTDAAKQAIQKMLGLDGLVGPYEADITADRAYAIGETFVMDGKRYKATVAIAQGGIITPGTNCELDPLDGRYVRNTDIATTSHVGVVKVGDGFNNPGDGTLNVDFASADNIKAGATQRKSISPYQQHRAVFYGLAKLAGVDLASGSDVVGTYPQNAKTAIQTMLGITPLPTVAAADNGKILQVVNGEWAAATIPNANGVSF